MAPQPGVGGGYSLRFSGLSAMDLPETETWPFGKQDPYVKLSLPNKPAVQSTVVEEGGSSLSWPASESLTVPLSEEDLGTGTLLRVEVWNKNKLMDDLIGYATLELKSLLGGAAGVDVPQAFSLRRDKVSKGPLQQGTLKCHVSLTDHRPPPTTPTPTPPAPAKPAAPSEQPKAPVEPSKAPAKPSIDPTPAPSSKPEASVPQAQAVKADLQGAAPVTGAADVRVMESGPPPSSAGPVPFFKRPKPIEAVAEADDKAEAKGAGAVASAGPGGPGRGEGEEGKGGVQAPGAPAAPVSDKALVGLSKVEEGHHVLVRLQALEASDLVETELLRLGGDKQDPYLKLTVPGTHPSTSRTKAVDNAGTACKWEGEVVSLPRLTCKELQATSLQLEVWNDNAPLPDTLIGSAKLQLDAPTLLPLGAQGKPIELELTLPDKPTTKRGKLRLTAAASLAPEVAVPASPAVSALKALQSRAAPAKVEAPQPSSEAKPPAEKSEPKPTSAAKPEGAAKFEALQSKTEVAQAEAAASVKEEAAKHTEDKGVAAKETAPPSAKASGPVVAASKPIADEDLLDVKLIGLEASDLVETEMLRLGGNKQDPYLKLTVPGTHPSTSRTKAADNAGNACKWEGEKLTLPRLAAKDFNNASLLLEVWNDNSPLPDTLIGSAKLQLDTATLLPLGTQGKAIELELSLPDKPTTKRGKLRLTAVAAPVVEQPKPSKPEAPAAVLQSSAKAEARPAVDTVQPLAPDVAAAAKTAEAKGAVSGATGPVEDKLGSKQIFTPAPATAGTASVAQFPGVEEVDVRLQGLHAFELVETEMLRLGGNKQDPYLKLTVPGKRPSTSRTKAVDNAGSACKWEGETLALPRLAVKDLSTTELILEVWNENARLPDTLIGSAKLQLDAPTLLPLGPDGKAMVVELTLPDKPTTKRGKVGITVVLTPVAPAVPATSAQQAPVSVASAKEEKVSHSTKGEGAATKAGVSQATPGAHTSSVPASTHTNGTEQVDVRLQGLHAFELVETELLRLGGNKQDPYLKLTVPGPTPFTSRTKAVNNAGSACKWEGETLALPRLAVKDLSTTELTLEVWNDNSPLPDTLIGSAKLQLDTATLLPLGAQGKAIELELSLPDKPTTKRGKVGITAVLTPVAPPAPPKEDKGRPSTSGEAAVTKDGAPQALPGVGSASVAASLHTDDTDQVDVRLRGLHAFELVETELLRLGGNKQDPYLKLTVPGKSPFTSQTKAVENAGSACKWEGETLALPRLAAKDLSTTELILEVWNDNSPLPDTLIGSAKLRLDAPTLLPLGPDGKALVVELTQPGKGGQAAPRGKLGLTAVVIAVPPTAAAKEGQPSPSGEAKTSDGAVVQASGPAVKLSDSVRLSVAGLEAWDLPKTEMMGKDDPYIKLRIEGHEPRKTSTKDDVGGGRVSWPGEVLELPVLTARDIANTDIRLEVWNENMAPFPDKLMGWAVLRMDQPLLAQMLGSHTSGLVRTMPLNQEKGQKGNLRLTLMGEVVKEAPQASKASDKAPSEEVLSPTDAVKADPAQLQLRLSCLEAVQLLNKEWAVVGGKADPFLVFKLGGQTLKTITKQNAGTSCSWGSDYSLDFQVTGSMLRSLDLEVEAFDEGIMGNNTLIGTGKMRVDHLLKPSSLGKAEPTVLQLFTKDKKPAGQIKLALTCRDVEAPVPLATAPATQGGEGSSTGTGIRAQDRLVLTFKKLSVSDVPDVRGLLSSVANRVADPFLRFKLGAQIAQTKTCLNGGSKGEWGEALELETSGEWLLSQAQAGASGALMLEVWHDNTLQDAPVAHAPLPIAGGLCLDSPHVLEVPLSLLTESKKVDKTKGGVFRGTLSITKKVDDATDAAKHEVLSEGPGVLAVRVLDLAGLRSPISEPVVTLHLSPLDMTASTRKLLEQKGGSKTHEEQAGGNGHYVWDQLLELPCYSPPRVGPSARLPMLLTAKLLKPGAIMGEGLVGSAALDVTDVIRAGTKTRLAFPLSNKAGTLNLELEFSPAVEAAVVKPPTSGQKQPVSDAPCVPGLLQIYVLEASGLRTVEQKQDPYVSIRRLPLSPLQALSKEAQAVVKTRTIQDVDGASVAWLQCLSLPLTKEDASFLLKNPTVLPQLEVTVMDEQRLLGMHTDRHIAGTTIPVSTQAFACKGKPFRWWELKWEGREAGSLKLAITFTSRDETSFEELSGPQQALSQPGVLHMWVKAAHGVKGGAKKEVHVEARITTVAAEAKKASLFGALTGKPREGTMGATPAAIVGNDVARFDTMLTLQHLPQSQDEDAQPPSLKVSLRLRGLLFGSTELGAVDIPLSAITNDIKAGAGGLVDAASVVASLSTKHLPLIHGEGSCGTLEVAYVFVPGSVQHNPAVTACVEKLRADASKAHSAQKATPMPAASPAADPNAIPGSVCVRVSKGEDLPQVESKQDPYVHMTLATSHGCRRWQSKVHKDGGASPVWEETCVLYSDDLRLDAIAIAIKDGDNMLYDEVIGQLSVPLAPLLSQAKQAAGAKDKIPRQGWFTVLDAHGKETPGRLFLSITLLPDPPSLREQTRKALAYGAATATANQALVLELVGVQREENDEQHTDLDKTATPRDMEEGAVTVSLQPLAVFVPSGAASVGKPLEPGKPLVFKAEELTAVARSAYDAWSSPSLLFTLEGAPAAPASCWLPLPQLLTQAVSGAVNKKLPFATSATIKGKQTQITGFLHVRVSITGAAAATPHKQPVQATGTPVADVLVACVGARGLPAVDGFLGGKNDPFVKLSIEPGGACAQTSVLKDAGANPMWNEHRVLRVADVCNGVLRVAVWDHNDVTSHQLIAQTTLSTAGLKAALAQLAPAQTPADKGKSATPAESKLEFWCPLYRTEPSKPKAPPQPAGEIRLCLELADATEQAGAEPQVAGGYELERRSGDLLVTVVEARGTPLSTHKNPGRALDVQLELKPGNFTAETAAKPGPHCVWEEQVAVPLLWTPQHTDVPQLTVKLEAKKGLLLLGDATLACLTIPTAPLVLHPMQVMDRWFRAPLLTALGHKDGEAEVELRLRLSYHPCTPQPDGKAPLPGRRPMVLPASRPLADGFIHVTMLGTQHLPPPTKQGGRTLRATLLTQHGPSSPGDVALESVGKGTEASLVRVAYKETGESSTPIVLLEVMDGKTLVGSTHVPIFSSAFAPPQSTEQNGVWYPLTKPNETRTVGQVMLQLRYYKTGEEPKPKTSESSAADGTSKASTEGSRTLHLTVVEGKGLRELELLGSQDPMVKVEVLGCESKAQTGAVKDGGKNPKWPQGTGSLDLHLPTTVDASQATLRLHVVNGQQWSLRAGGVIGRCDWVLPTAVVRGREDSEKWLQLIDDKGQPTAGQLLIRVGVTPKEALTPREQEVLVAKGVIQAPTPVVEPKKQDAAPVKDGKVAAAKPTVTAPLEDLSKQAPEPPKPSDSGKSGVAGRRGSKNTTGRRGSGTSAGSFDGGRLLEPLSKESEAADRARTLISKLEGSRKAPSTLALPRDVRNWRVANVLSWLSEVIELPQYAQLFHAKAIDGLLLLQLNEELINKELSIPETLHRMKLVTHIKNLQAQHAQWLIEDEKRRAKEEAERLREEEAEKEREERKQRKRDAKTAKSASAATLRPPEAPGVESLEAAQQVLARARLQRLIADKAAEDEAAKKAGSPTQDHGWKFGYDGANRGKEGEEAEGGFRDAMATMWKTLHQGEALVQQDGTIRTFPVHSSWFEILAVLREGIRDLGHKLRLEREMEALQMLDSDLGDEKLDSEGPRRSEEEEELELVYKTFVGMRNNGARWLGNNEKLTRLKLLGGIRQFLNMELSWEQFDNLYRYLSPEANGKKAHLSLQEFIDAFRPLHPGSPKRSRALRGLRGHDVAVDDLLSGQGMQRGTELIRRVMSCVSRTLLAHGLSLQEVLWCFDRNGDGSVSLSEFSSLMRLLLGPRSGVGRHEVALVMGAIDSSLDRRLQSEELRAFFYHLWSEQLRSARDQLALSPDDPQAQKKVHGLRSLIRRNFTREFRDSVRGQHGLCGPFAALLRRMGIVPHEETDLGASSEDEEEEKEKGTQAATDNSKARHPSRPTKKRASGAVRAGRNSILQYRLHSARLPTRPNALLTTPPTTQVDGVRLTTAYNRTEMVDNMRLFTQPRTHTTPKPRK